MSNEVRELKEHVGWLERQLERIDGVGDAVDGIDGRMDDQTEILGRVAECLKDINDSVKRICDVIDKQNGTVRDLVEAIQSIPDALQKAAAPQQSQPKQSPFEEAFDHLKHAERSKRRPQQRTFKPKIVKPDEPGPGAA